MRVCLVWSLQRANSQDLCERESPETHQEVESGQLQTRQGLVVMAGSGVDFRGEDLEETMDS